MRRKGYTFLALITLLSFQYLSGQSLTSFIVPDSTVEHTSVFKSHIKVANFEKIVGFQFTLQWDADVLQFKGLDNLNEMLSQEDDFGKDSVSIGRLTIKWYDTSLKGISMADSSVVFSIVFEAIGAVGNKSQVKFTDMPTAKEVVDDSYDAIESVFKDGVITIGEKELSTGLIYNNAPGEIRAEEAFPNPFSGFTTLRYTLNKPTKATLSVFDMKGELVWEEPRSLFAGLNEIRIAASQLTQAGKYIVQLKATSFLVTQSIIKL